MKIENGFMRGVAGPVVFYEMKGKQYGRAKPKSRPKRKEKLATNSIFGIVSQNGTPMAHHIKYHLPNHFSNESWNMVRGFMRKQYEANLGKDWPLEIRRAANGQVNPQADLRNFLGVDATVTLATGKITVSLPALEPNSNLMCPLHTHQVRLTCTLITSPFENGLQPASDLLEYVFSLREPIPAKDFIFTPNAKPGYLALVVIALQFATSPEVPVQYNKDPTLLPAGVVGMGRV